MASAVVYQCSVCNRTIQLPVNVQGLEVVGGCIITNNCKGLLSVIGRRDNVLQIPVPTPSQTGLKDWEQRKLLYTHTQTTAFNQWRIVHNLGTNPAIQVYVYIDGVLTEHIPESVTYISPFIAVVAFSQIFAGTAQCVARSTSTITQTNIASVVATQTYSQITTQGEMTLATLSASPSVTLYLNFYDSATLKPLGAPIPVVFSTAVSFISPWNSAATVLFNGQVFTVRTANVISIIGANNISNDSPFYFSGESSNDYYVLFAIPPYTNVDKNINQALMLTDLGVSDSSFTPSLSYQMDGDLFVDSTLLKTMYPPIRKLN
jgi:hypothetical protein